MAAAAAAHQSRILSWCLECVFGTFVCVSALAVVGTVAALQQEGRHSFKAVLEVGRTE